jgi:hypothetical protein
VPSAVELHNELDDFVMVLTFASGQHCAFVMRACLMVFPFERIELYGDHARLSPRKWSKWRTHRPGAGHRAAQFFSARHAGQMGL